VILRSYASRPVSAARSPCDSITTLFVAGQRVLSRTMVLSVLRIYRLEKFWNNQEMIFNYKSELTGIGNRSNII